MIENDEQVSELIKDYFYQLTVGCDTIDCQEAECASSPNFKNQFQTKTDAAVHAVELALHHSFNPHLCRGRNHFLVNLQIQNQTKNFDLLINKILNNNFPSVPEESARRIIVNIVNSEINIAYILLSNNFKLSLTNMAIDDNLIREFPLVFQRAFTYFETYSLLFNQMVLRFLNTTNSATYSHVRGLIMILLFDIYFSQSNFMNLLNQLN